MEFAGSDKPEQEYQKQITIETPLDRQLPDERRRCVDRGPAWIAVFCACLILAIHYGVIVCGALFFSGLMEVTGYPISVVTWLSTGQFALTFCLAPLHNWIMDFVQLRPTICTTVILTTCAVISASFMSNYFVILFLYTVVGGFGFGLSVVRVVPIVTGYFDRYRVIALAICSSGVGLGILTLSKLGALMVEAYTWRRAMVGFALIHLNCIPLFLVLKPLSMEPKPDTVVKFKKISTARKVTNKDNCAVHSQAEICLVETAKLSEKLDVHSCEPDIGLVRDKSGHFLSVQKLRLPDEEPASEQSVASPGDRMIPIAGSETKSQKPAPNTSWRRRCILFRPIFLSFLFSQLLIFITVSIVLGHLTNFGLTLNFAPVKAANLLSFIGLTTMLARIVVGMFAQFAAKGKLGALTAVCTCMLAVYVIIMPWFPYYPALSAFAICYGALVSPAFAFAPTISYDIIGPEHYYEAVAYLYQFQAVGYLIGGPIGGAVKETSKDYRYCFLLAGITGLLSATILASQTTYLLVQQWRQSKANLSSPATGQKSGASKCRLFVCEPHQIKPSPAPCQRLTHAIRLALPLCYYNKAQKPPLYSGALDERRDCIDKWPAWFVAICACITCGIMYGTFNCGALFSPGLMELTGYPISVVSWTITGQSAIALCLAPLYNMIMDRVPNRLAVVMATLLTTAAFIGASMTKTFLGFLLTYTLIAGFGCGIAIVRVFAIVAEYFDRYRVLALALCSSGAGLGTFVLSKVGALMIEYYTWRIGVIGYGLIILNVIPLSLALRPLPAEPPPEQMVIVPNHPDHTKSDLSADGPSHIAQSDSQNLFLSMVKIGTNEDQTQQVVQSPSSRAHSLKVVIEFVREKFDDIHNQIVISPITFLTDPGPKVFQQLENVANTHLLGLNPLSDTVLVPIIFIVGEIKATFETEFRGAVTGSDLDIMLQSRMDVFRSQQYLNEEESKSAPRRQSVIHGTIASTSVAAFDRRELRRNVRGVMKLAEQRVKRCTKRLTAMGRWVAENPIVVLIDQGDYSMDGKVDSDVIHGDISILHHNQLPAVDRGSTTKVVEQTSSTGGSYKIVWSANEPLETCMKEGAEAPPGIATEQRMYKDSTDMKTSNNLEDPYQIRWPTNSTASIFHATDISASVISIAKPESAVNLLVSKLQHESQSPAGGRKLPKFLLFSPLFFTFLMSRVLVFATDSIMYAHLSNFAIALNYNPEQGATLLSFVGIANMIARLSTGFAGQFVKQINARVLVSSTLLITGIYIALMPLATSLLALSIFSITYGVLSSPSSAYSPIMSYEIIGPERYEEAVSFLLQFEALGFLTGGPIGGVLKEVRNNYADCFAAAGVFELIASFILAVHALILSPLGRRLGQKICRQKDVKSNEIPEEEICTELEEYTAV
ncbi:unnamed protein product [Calicophoron daubneyi]|uniref:Major facilitator superfamily (MFS) profile domain-containing protein n=1 Tax=Calicophoron daubneyi TaxID=300641 RepID=A0AAV2TP05_CALDB